jgi:hypothetical protein
MGGSTNKRRELSEITTFFGIRRKLGTYPLKYKRMNPSEVVRLSANLMPKFGFDLERHRIVFIDVSFQETTNSEPAEQSQRALPGGPLPPALTQ